MNAPVVPLWGSKDVARYLGCSTRYAQRLMRSGDIEARKVAARWVTSEACVLRFLGFQNEQEREGEE